MIRVVLLTKGWTNGAKNRRLSPAAALVRRIALIRTDWIEAFVIF
jgi:hypothetical protein